MLFVSAKVSQFALLPQGEVEATDRVLNMVKQMDEEGFGNCTNTGACEVECPKGISLENIARMNREFLSQRQLLQKARYKHILREYEKLLFLSGFFVCIIRVWFSVNLIEDPVRRHFPSYSSLTWQFVKLIIVLILCPIFKGSLSSKLASSWNRASLRLMSALSAINAAIHQFESRLS